MAMRKIFAMITALITGGIGIAALSTAQQASAALTTNQVKQMRKILAIIGALITGGIGIVTVGMQSAQAALSAN